MTFKINHLHMSTYFNCIITNFILFLKNLYLFPLFSPIQGSLATFFTPIHSSDTKFSWYKFSVMQDELILEICSRAQGLWSKIIYCALETLLKG